MTHLFGLCLRPVSVGDLFPAHGCWLLLLQLQQLLGACPARWHHLRNFAPLYFKLSFDAERKRRLVLLLLSAAAAAAVKVLYLSGTDQRR